MTIRRPTLLQVTRSAALAGVVSTAIFANLVVLYDLNWSYDLVVADATIHDGRGGSPFFGTIAVRGDQIVRVWRGSTPRIRPLAKAVIYARSLDLAPGFIDTHSHADGSLGLRSTVRIDNLVEQGVTTAVVGNCGRSRLPIAALASQIQDEGANINVAILIGYNSVRQAVMGGAVSPAEPDQIRQICTLITKGLRDGAIGLSTGFPYVPGRFASDEELLAALMATAAEGGIHASHIRDEGSQVVAAVAEVGRLSAQAGTPLVISHLKITGPANCSQLPRLFETISEQTSELRGRLYFDVYPYVSSSTTLDLYAPNWFVGEPPDEQRRTLRSRNERARLKADLRARLLQEGYEDLDFMVIASSSRRGWDGHSIAEMARHDPGVRASLDTQLDTMLDLLGRGGAQINYRNICVEAVADIVGRLPVMIGTDSAIRYQGGGSPHPRGWGTFPRVLSQFVRRGRVLTLDQAIERMTSLPASVFGFTDRGVIDTGYFADLVLFDAEETHDTATYANPFGRPVGIRAVWVNATLVGGEWKASLGRLTLPQSGMYAGRFLRRQQMHVDRPHGSGTDRDSSDIRILDDADIEVRRNY